MTPKAPKQKKLSPAEKMLAGKRRLISRLNDDIADIRAVADEDIARIKRRIDVAKVLIEALEKGTLNL